MSNYIQSNQCVQLLNANTIISAVDSGKILLIPSLATSDKTYTLPVLTAGLHYRFIVNSNNAITQNAIIQPGSAAGAPVNGLVNGMLVNSPTATTLAGIRKNAGNTVTFATGVAIPGDYVDCYCDGIAWYVQGMSSANGGLA